MRVAFNIWLAGMFLGLSYLKQCPFEISARENRNRLKQHLEIPIAVPTFYPLHHLVDAIFAGPSHHVAVDPKMRRQARAHRLQQLVWVDSDYPRSDNMF